MSNYQGYLLKFGNTILPNQYFTDYSSVPSRISDEDAGTDQTGRLWRSPLPHKRSTAKFTVKKMVLDKKIAFQSIVQGAITNAAERKMTVTYWNDDVNDYRTTECYVPDIEYSVRDADATTIYYNPISVELIEY